MLPDGYHYNRDAWAPEHASVVITTRSDGPDLEMGLQIEGSNLGSRSSDHDIDLQDRGVRSPDLGVQYEVSGCWESVHSMCALAHWMYPQPKGPHHAWIQDMPRGQYHEVMMAHDVHI